MSRHGPGIAEVTLDVPPVNALDAEGWFELARTLDAQGADPGVRAVLLRAAHFTKCLPDCGRDEAFQRAYAQAAADPAAWAAFARSFLAHPDESSYQQAVENFCGGARGDDDDGRAWGSATRAEVCVTACADAWRGDGEIVAGPMGVIPTLGARLARAAFEPDLVLSDGQAHLMAGAVRLGAGADELIVEGWLPYRAVLDLLAGGRRHVVRDPGSPYSVLIQTVVWVRTGEDSVMAVFGEGAPCWVDAMLPDLEAGKRFYGDLFGWTFQEGDEKYGYYTQAFRDGKNVAALAPKPDGRMPTVWNVYFESSDAAGTARKIGDAGGQVFMEPMRVGDFGTMLMAVDPGGATFGVWQPGEHKGFELQGEPGSFCWTESYTRDVKAVDPFYEAVFGLKGKQIGDGKTFDYVVWTQPETKKSLAGRMLMDDSFPAELPPHYTVFFAVDNCDEAVNKVTAHGGRVIRDPMDSPFGRMAVVADDQGAAFAVIDISTTVGERPEGM